LALSIALALGSTYEGTRLTAYHDPGNGTPTICMGETHGVFMGMTQTLAECQVMFSGAMNERVIFVKAHVKKAQPETRIAALADFAYNEGERTLLASIAWRDINAGNLAQGCPALLNYTTAAKKYLSGLAKRRYDECQLCLIGTPYPTSTCGVQP
jgi:lysozyme